MSLVAPKLRNLTGLVEDGFQSAESTVWDICVPSDKSFYWSVLLSYGILSEKLEKITDAYKTIEHLKIKFREFNPFINTSSMFMNNESLENFESYLKDFEEEDQDEDSFTQRLSCMLECKIVVYVTNKKEKKEFVPEKRLMSKFPTIILLQSPYHNSRCSPEINIYSFGMFTEDAFPLQLKALEYFLRKAKLSLEEINQIKKLIKDHKCGEKFLLLVLQADSVLKVLPKLYKSPYIAFKLSESGFEMDPTKIDLEISVFAYAAAKNGNEYLRILYDYAANCRYTFDDSTVRNPNDIVFKCLTEINKILMKDASSLTYTSSIKNSNKTALAVVQQFIQFNNYQKEIVHFMVNNNSEPLRNAKKRNAEKLIKLHKHLLQTYTDYFYFSISDTQSAFEKAVNYVRYSEFYENIDESYCLSFFDSLYMLKNCLNSESSIFIRSEDLLFILIVINKHIHEIVKSENSKPLDKLCIKLIPMLFREDLKVEIKNLLENLKNIDTSTISSDDYKTDYRCLDDFPAIKDELFFNRLMNYMTVASEVTSDEDAVKYILVIERALQVLGETIKLQSSERCVVNSLLRSQMSMEHIKILVILRNRLSHYRCNSSLGRLNIETNVDYFKDLQKELAIIGNCFLIVQVTQHCRLEKFYLEISLKKTILKELPEHIQTRFNQLIETRYRNINGNLIKYREKCIQLSLDSIEYLLKYIDFNELKECENINNIDKSYVSNILYSIEYVFEFIEKDLNENSFQEYVLDLKYIYKEYNNSMKIETLFNQMRNIYKHIRQHFNIFQDSNRKPQLPKLLTLIDHLKWDVFTKNEIIRVLTVIKKVYDEAMNAKTTLVTEIKQFNFSTTGSNGTQINKLLMSKTRLRNLKQNMQNGKKRIIVRQLYKKWGLLSSVCLKIKNILTNNSLDDSIEQNLLFKIAYKSDLNIYTSDDLDDIIRKKICNLFTRKIDFLLSRIENMKKILIDEDSETENTWRLEKNKEIKHHIRFLMRQRFLRDMKVRASLEMALLDCLNILKSNEFCETYEKMNHLFSGINVRHVLAHGHNVLETIGGLLDEDDLPTDLINKMLELIDDYEAISALRDLISHFSLFDAEQFKDWISNNTEIRYKNKLEKIKSSPRWKNYLILLP